MKGCGHGDLLAASLRDSIIQEIKQGCPRWGLPVNGGSHPGVPGLRVQFKRPTGVLGRYSSRWVRVAEDGLI